MRHRTLNRHGKGQQGTDPGQAERARKETGKGDGVKSKVNKGGNGMGWSSREELAARRRANEQIAVVAMSRTLLRGMAGGRSCPPTDGQGDIWESDGRFSTEETRRDVQMMIDAANAAGSQSESESEELHSDIPGEESRRPQRMRAQTTSPWAYRGWMERESPALN